MSRVFAGNWRARNWRERVVFWLSVVVLAAAYGWLAWRDGVGFWVSCYGDACGIAMNPIFWWPEFVTGTAPAGEGSLLVYPAYWLIMGILTAKLLITATSMVRDRLTKRIV